LRGACLPIGRFATKQSFDYNSKTRSLRSTRDDKFTFETASFYLKNFPITKSIIKKYSRTILNYVILFYQINKLIGEL